MRRPRKGEIPINHERERTPVPIVADGAMANARVGDGRMIPVVIFDTSGRPDLEEYVRLHHVIPTGDVKSLWGQLEGHTDTIALILTFIKPAELIAVIEFNLERNQGILVEQIMGTHGLYIQPGRPGDRLKHDPNRPKIIIEIPDTGWRPPWEEIYEKYIIQKMRRAGLPRPNAKRAAKMFLEETRKVFAFRMKERPS